MSSPRFDTMLYHVTEAPLANSLAATGMRKGSYWATEEISAYYREGVEEEGEKPLTLALPLSVLMAYNPAPDRPGLDEPITTVLGMREDAVLSAWSSTDKSWRACLNLIGSMRCQDAIPSEVLLKHNPGLEPSVEPVRSHRPR